MTSMTLPLDPPLDGRIIGLSLQGLSSRREAALRRLAAAEAVRGLEAL